MVDLILVQLSPEQLERLERLADMSRRRAVRSRSRKSLSPLRRSRQYPGGRPNPWRAARLRRRYSW
ncbi:hypothetical protein [Streptomyces sp. H39-C1]|uniref:hypothetical protein n=1 Tax=Streptomyces sp. H39-C1 TaxID=3004355 RepID=UPI0022AEFA4A|nr:hypothetical protein [Streptomyces sp. H39-C1]MCZ4100998.1 hypothetical protein [Streptomyces sp. H39-C1]